jgi:hypothetical protein
MLSSPALSVVVAAAAAAAVVLVGAVEVERKKK